MTGYRRTHGSRPLLFERLVGSARTEAGAIAPWLDQEPPRLHDQEGLRASIRRELTDLLNTRAPLPIGTLEERKRTAVDYGIPDLSAFPIGERDAMDRLRKHVRDAIAVYEPRLHNPTVEMGRAAGNDGPLTVTIYGALEAGTIRAAPVSFALTTGAADLDDA